MTPTLTLVLSLLLDRLAGETQRWHPVAGFGRLAGYVEAFLHPGSKSDERVLIARLRGVAAVVLLVVPFMVAAGILSEMKVTGKLFDVLILYLSIGSLSLRQHAEAVATALKKGNLAEARLQVGKMVSRDTGSLQEDGVVRATIESVLENGNDAIFAPIFWFMLAGAPGVVLYRLTNTLDAMWGYKNERYFNFGWAAARLDDLLNFLPARLTALTYTVLGKWREAWQCWHNQGRLWVSPNAGAVMASGAGALAVQLGGPAFYEGIRRSRPDLGTGKAPGIDDIGLSLVLVEKGIILWAIFFLVEGLLCA